MPKHISMRAMEKSLRRVTADAGLAPAVAYATAFIARHFRRRGAYPSGLPPSKMRTIRMLPANGIAAGERNGLELTLTFAPGPAERTRRRIAP
jgi:hypothetical protein